MTPNEYQDLAMRTAGNDDLVTNGILGLNGEAGELADLLKKCLFQGHEFDYDKVIEELGDVLWYCAILAEGMCIDLEDVMKMNIDKLKKRYPEGFSSERSINRDEYYEVV